MLYKLRGDPQKALAEWIEVNHMPKGSILKELESIRRAEFEQKVIESVQCHMQGAFGAYQMELKLN
jgi:hypothetical protein